MLIGAVGVGALVCCWSIGVCCCVLLRVGVCCCVLIDVDGCHCLLIGDDRCWYMLLAVGVNMYWYWY